MTRPALLIGVGGTGQWVLTYVKKELLEIGKGAMPPGVKLLVFDTASNTTATTGQSSKTRGEEDIHAGSVRLEEGTEFIPIGENVGALASEIAAGKHPHLQWFPAKAFLGKLTSASFNTKEGSGQIRHMGRISLFRDVMDLNHSMILSHIRAAILDLQGKVSRDNQLEVMIVGSLAGGTGAGMLVDMALLVRAQAARLVQQNYIVRGFFVLPRAFVPGGLGEGRDMLARAFACWRELDRFMIASERFGVRQMNYHETNTDLRIRIDKRAYDVSYMLDTARVQNPLDNVRPEDGLFPAVAHVISAILDEKAGKEYTEFVTTNLSGKLAQLPRRPYHSAIGSYTIKVPVYYAEAKFSHQLALDVLREFLVPDVNEKGRVVGVSEIHNREVGEHELDKTRAALRFMAASAVGPSGNEIPNTRFLPLVAEIREKEGLRNNQMIQQVARGGLTTGNSRFLNALTDISQDEEGKLIVRDIADELNIPIWREVAPSSVAGDAPESAFARIKNRVLQVRQEHYGIDTVAGERLRGKYGKSLERAKGAQIARFRRLLRVWTLNILNGQSTDPHLARSGKIGYARAFYSGLIENLDYFIRFLNAIRQTRNEELRLAARTRQAADAALREYERLRGKKCWLTFWDDFTHPDAHRAQRNYLFAEQRDIDVRKDDILLDVLTETAMEMRSIAEQTLSEIDNWISHLATGEPNLGIVGLYPKALESLSEINANHELDKRLFRISQLIGEHEYKTNEEYLFEALKCLKWGVEETPTGLNLVCGIEFSSDDSTHPPLFKPFRRDGENPAGYNLELILRLAQSPFKSIHQERPLALEITKVYTTGKKLAEEVENKADPMYAQAATVRGAEVVACYIRVHAGVNDETIRYFAEFQDEMKRRKPNIKGSSLTLTDSEDHHKMTIVCSDDLLPSEDFHMWHMCREAYINQVTDLSKSIPAAELHIFPAEINACSYEAEMPAIIGQNYRTLHPEVVALLEDKDRFEMFWRAYALGFVKKVEEDRGAYWIYQVPGMREPLYLSVPPRAFGEKEDDIFQVIHNFVMEGVDQRPGKNQQLFIDWNDLYEAILSAHREMGKKDTLKRYRQQIDHESGIVKVLRREVKTRQATVRDESLRRFEAQELLDLADVANVVYEKAIQSLENRSI